MCGAALTLQPWRPFSRVGVIATLVALALFFALVLGSERGFVPVLDSANLAFHEAGHQLYGVLGNGPGLYGGTLGQLTFPLVVLVVFFVRRQPLSLVAGGVWLGENLLNIARYMGDARAQELPLVGGGEHDWWHIFTRWDALASDTRVARVTAGLGWVVMLGCVGWLLWRWRADERAGRMAELGQL